MERISNTQAVYTIAKALLSCEVRPIDDAAIDKATAAAIVAHREFQSNFQTRMAKWMVGRSDPLYQDIKNKLEEEWRSLPTGLVEPMQIDQDPHPYAPQPHKQPQQVQPQYRIEAIPRRALESPANPGNQLPSNSQAQGDAESKSANNFCRNCGKQLSEGGNFCISCGTRIVP